MDDLERLAVNTIKFLSIDAIEKANSGHPGLPMGAADYRVRSLVALLAATIRSDPHWPDRDRFVLSAGHGSMLLYSLLHLSGYDLSLDELKHFRQWGIEDAGPSRVRTSRRASRRPPVRSARASRNARRHGARRPRWPRRASRPGLVSITASAASSPTAT